MSFPLFVKLNFIIVSFFVSHHKDAWVDEESIQTGYEINFTKYFYVPKKLPSVKELVEDIKRLEAESEGLMDSILEGLDYEI